MKKSQVIVLIFHHSSNLNWYEKISLQQCFRVLNRHPIRLICPEGTNLSEFQRIAPDIIADPVPVKWMSTLRRYNRMKMMPPLYNRYKNYEHMLTYELDAFVFEDQLDSWCQSGYDYLGAPWIEREGESTSNLRFTGIGNSGFSLRNIDSAIRALNTFCLLTRPKVMAKRALNRGKALVAIKEFVMACTLYNSHWMIHRSPFNEDRFWHFVGDRQSWFKMPSNEIAARFSFEQEPQQLFELCDGRLPFGCHAWAKYDLNFWRPIIEAQGFNIPKQAP